MTKRFIFVAFSLLICLATIRCEKDMDNIQISLLKRNWTHSYEESRGTYRPSDDMDFPPSRYRQVFKFKEKGICAYSVLAPNDAHYMENGSWKFYKNHNTIEISNPESEVIYEYEILELAEDILVVKQLN